jgi:hypothetical protein
MAALTQLSVPLDGSEYTSWDVYRKTIKHWLIVGKFNFATPTKNKTRAIYTCVVNKYPWKYRARRNIHGIIKLCIIKGKYIYDGAAETKRKPSSNKEILDEAIFQFIRINKKTAVKEIINYIALQFSKTISYQIIFNYF